MTTVKQARQIAQEWVEREAKNLPGFYGAFTHGSVNWLSDEATLDPSSDLDIMVAFDSPPSVKLGKIIYRNLILEISYMKAQELQSAEAVLSTSHLAGSFHRPSVLADPTGELSELQRTVAKHYAQKEWVLKRCEDVEAKLRRNLGSLDESTPLHASVMSWLFGTSLSTHMLLVAGLKNPTVRKRYVATKALLDDYQKAEYQETLLAMLGCRDLTRDQVQSYLDRLVPLYDIVGPLIRTPVFFASDLSKDARPIAIDGSQGLIDNGLHREAIFWIVATYTRCLHVLDVDGTEEQKDKFIPGFQCLMADLGITTFADLTRRAEQLEVSLPEVWAVAHGIIDNNPQIER